MVLLSGLQCSLLILFLFCSNAVTTKDHLGKLVSAQQPLCLHYHHSWNVLCLQNWLTMWSVFLTLTLARICTHLVLYKHAKGLKVGDYVTGACGPRYHRSSIVLAKLLGTDCVSLAKVEIYAECTVILKNSNTRHTHWLAAVFYFEEHPCRVWYSSPTQV